MFDLDRALRNYRRLTDREHEVLMWLAGTGMTRAEVGCQLGISAKTVDYFVLSIQEKLRVYGQLQAICVFWHREFWKVQGDRFAELKRTKQQHMEMAALKRWKHEQQELLFLLNENMMRQGFLSESDQ